MSSDISELDTICERMTGVRVEEIDSSIPCLHIYSGFDRNESIRRLLNDNVPREVFRTYSGMPNLCLEEMSDRQLLILMIRHFVGVEIFMNGNMEAFSVVDVAKYNALARKYVPADERSLGEDETESESEEDDDIHYRSRSRFENSLRI